MSLPTSGFRSKLSRKPARSRQQFYYAGFLLGLLLNLEDVGDMFL
jgi:hypothetical protein